MNRQAREILWPNATQAEWDDPKWQLRHSVRRLEQIEQVLRLTPEEREGVKLADRKLVMAITPHFMNLIDLRDPHCPLRRQVVPRIEEMRPAPDESIDPLAEDNTTVVPGLVHRYPDRVLLLITNKCASYCRYCTRSRVVGQSDVFLFKEILEGAARYLEKHPEVRDVLISGGDPLLLNDPHLELVIARLRQIPSIEIIRIGTRIPIFLPQRVTPALTAMLKKYHPLWMNIHVNHPAELTPEVQQATARLLEAGIPLGCQTVLLRGVNDSPAVMKELMHQLLQFRIRPYYIYQCDPVVGTHHLKTSVEKGLEIMESLRGHTTGFAVPTYVIDAPGGGGKIPVAPNYIVAWKKDRVILRNFKGEKFEYRFNPLEKGAAEQPVWEGEPAFPQGRTLRRGKGNPRR